jgi:erythronate-4-phosphate dehydrogenase
MNIVAVENIPYIEEACKGLGSVTIVPPRGMEPAVVRDADALLVRSGKKIDQALLEGSRVKFVATATIGTDHIDNAFLEQNNIGFAAAPGCNANSVAEYIVSGLLVLALRHGLRLSEKSIGVVGIGNVGSKVVRKTRALGMKVLENDPPLQLITGDKRFVPIEEILQCDFVTFHVPLIGDGAYATRSMINENLLAKAKDGLFLFNSSRGGIMQTAAVINALDSGKIAGAVIDVWENEPNLSAELLEKAELGTPHIAGYSFDGKVNGTKMVYDAMCRHFNIGPSWTPEGVVPPPPVPEIKVEPKQAPVEERLAKIVHLIYDVKSDDRQLRKILEMPESEHGPYFDNMRRNYPVRREFQNTTVTFERGDEIAETVAGLGFKTAGK